MTYFVRKNRFYLKLDWRENGTHVLTSDKESASVFKVLGEARTFSETIRGEIAIPKTSDHSEKLRASKNHVELHFHFLSDIREFN